MTWFIYTAISAVKSDTPHLRRELLTPPHPPGHDELVAEAVTPAA